MFEHELLVSPQYVLQIDSTYCMAHLQRTYMAFMMSQLLPLHMRSGFCSHHSFEVGKALYILLATNPSQSGGLCPASSFGTLPTSPLPTMNLATSQVSLADTAWIALNRGNSSPCSASCGSTVVVSQTVRRSSASASFPNTLGRASCRHSMARVPDRA